MEFQGQSPQKTAQKVLPEQAGLSKPKFTKSVRKLSRFWAILVSWR
ncbi:MAG: hypothetical protein MR782_02435 [Campylobacter sp.]|nr:hypothetical protein [Campylobacter sp.]